MRLVSIGRARCRQENREMIFKEAVWMAEVRGD